jgi:hypothetical protein
MLHVKCVACRLRLATPGAPGDRVDELCPGCGILLEPVGELTEIVGFQAIGGAQPPKGLSDGHRRLATAVREVQELRRARGKTDPVHASVGLGPPR